MACKTVTFRKGGRRTVKLCDRSAKAKRAAAGKRIARAACRRGGDNWKSQYRKQLASGRKPTAHLFTKCR